MYLNSFTEVRMLVAPLYCCNYPPGGAASAATSVVRRLSQGVRQEVQVIMVLVRMATGPPGSRGCESTISEGLEERAQRGTFGALGRDGRLFCSNRKEYKIII